MKKLFGNKIIEEKKYWTVASVDFSLGIEFTQMSLKFC